MIEYFIKTYNTYIKPIIIDPISHNLTSVMFWFGLFMIFLGSIFGSTIDQWKYLPTGTGEAILKAGSAILGAGVFAIIMKSSQFIDVFQKHIYDVFYDPNKVKEKVSLNVKWRSLTEAIFKEFLPNSHLQAASEIENHYFNKEIEYHYEDHKTTYEVAFDKESNEATVTQTVETNIILSVNCTDPELENSIETEGTSEIVNYIINNKIVDYKKYITDVGGDGKHQKICIPLMSYVDKTKKQDDQKIKLKRIYKFKQNLKIEPQIISTINRYTRGASVAIKINDEIKYIFCTFGLKSDANKKDELNDGAGNKTWELAPNDKLLLPGQGYIIIMCPQHN